MQASTLAIGALVILSYFDLNAQRPINFSRYFDESVLPVLQREEFLQLPVEWKMPGAAQAILNAGLTDLDEQNFPSASENFLEFTRLQPNSFAGQYYLGVSRKAEGRNEEAKLALSEAIRLSPNCWQCEHELGNILLQQHRLKQAEKHFDRAIQLNPKSADTYFSIGHLELAKVGHEQKANPYTYVPSFGKAFRSYERATSVDPSFAKGFVMQGLIKMPNMLKRKDALVYFDKAIAADSTSREALFWRGIYFIYQNRPEEALRDWDRLVQYNPAIPKFVLMRGYLNVELERFDNAFADLRKAALANEVDEGRFRGQQTSFDKIIDLQFAAHYVMRSCYGLNPESFASFKKGFCYLVAGRNEESLKELDRAETSEKAAVIFFTKAIAYEHSGKHPQAFNYYSMAIEADPDIFDAYKKRSIYRTELKDWRGAMSDYREMVRLQPQSKITYKLRGFTKLNGGDFIGAIIDFTSFIKADSTDAEVYLNRGFCHDKLDNCRGASKDFLKGLQYDSLNQHMYDLTARQMLKCGDSLEALRIRRLQLSTIPPEFSPKPWIDLAELEIDLRKFTEAHRHIDEALRMIGQWTSGPLYARAARVKGLAYFKRQSYKEALEMFSRARKADADDIESWYLKAMCHMFLNERRMALREFDALQKRPYKDSAKYYASLLQADEKGSTR